MSETFMRNSQENDYMYLIFLLCFYQNKITFLRIREDNVCIIFFIFIKIFLKIYNLLLWTVVFYSSLFSVDILYFIDEFFMALFYTYALSNIIWVHITIQIMTI